MIIKSKYNFLKPYKVKKLIRLGRNFDGGYLICSDALKYCENLITLGVGDDISFEKDFDKKVKPKKIFLYDYTVNHQLFLMIILKYFRRLITFRTRMNNFMYSIINYLNYIKFANQQNVSLFKLRVVKKVTKNFDTTMNRVFKKIDSNKNLLKIDIEGGEYEIIDEIIRYNSKINILIIEFHLINKKSKLFIESVKKLKKKFDIIHLHANNYIPLDNYKDIFDVCEITLTNKSINKYKDRYRLNFPINNIDYECFPSRKKISFSFKN